MTQNGLNLDEAKACIDGLNFTLLKHKIRRTHGWTEKQTEAICEQYRHFLFIMKKYGEGLGMPPSKEIDEFWHAHILDTKRYKIDCDKIFGRYIDHYPYIGMDQKTSEKSAAKSFHKLQVWHKREFGDYIYQVLPNKLFAFVMSCCVKSYLYFVDNYKRDVVAEPPITEV